MGIDKAIDDHLNTQAYNPANFDDKIVLVVEDDRSHRNMMVNILSSCGFQTIQAESGFDALSQIDGADRPFDLIIMDWDMPGLDGLETTRAIRLREGKTGTLRTPVVAFTDHRKAEDRNICLASGMDAYLPKDALMPQWRQTLIDNLQGLFAGDFDISDFDTPETNVAQAAQFDLDEFDEELFSHTARLLKEDLQIAIEEYLEDAADYIKTIKEGIEQRDVVKAARGAHPLKSNSKSFGLISLSNVAEVINTVCESPDDEDEALEIASGFLSQIQTAFANGEKKLKHALKVMRF